MAFPIIEGTPVNSTTNTAGTSHTLTLPTGRVVGERIVFVVAVKSVTTMTATGWTVTQMGGGSSGPQLWVVWREVTGTLANTLSLSTGAVSTQMAARAWRISGHDPGTAPEFVVGSEGNATTYDPPNLAPSWSQADTLWFAFCHNGNGSRTFSVFPTGYTNTGTVVSSGTSGMVLAYSNKNANAPSDDPSAFTTSSGSAGSFAMTMAIKPFGANPPTIIAGSRGVGGATSSSFKASAKIFNHAAGDTVRLVVGTDESFTTGVVRSAAIAPDSFGYVMREVTGLSANTEYFYGWEHLAGGTTPITLLSTGQGKGNTTLPAGTAGNFSFWAVSCFNRDQTTGVASNHAHYSTLRDLNYMLGLHMGDKYYETDAEKYSTLESAYIGAHEAVYGASNAQSMYANTNVEPIFSDHDSVGNGAHSGRTGWTATHAAWRRIVPMLTLPDTDTLDRSFQIGRVHFYLLDGRSNASNPTATDDSSKFKISSAQETRFVNWATDSSRKYMPKVVISPELYYSNDTLGDDWGAYSTQRTRINNSLNTAGVTNLVWFSGDSHSSAFYSGGSITGGYPQVLASPGDKNPSNKGGTVTWTDGHVPIDTGQSTTYQQHVRCAVTDTGGDTITIGLAWRDETGATIGLADRTLTFTELTGAGTHLTRTADSSTAEITSSGSRSATLSRSAEAYVGEVTAAATQATTRPRSSTAYVGEATTTSNTDRDPVASVVVLPADTRLPAANLLPSVPEVVSLDRTANSHTETLIGSGTRSAALPRTANSHVATITGEANRVNESNRSVASHVAEVTGTSSLVGAPTVHRSGDSHVEPIQTDSMRSAALERTAEARASPIEADSITISALRRTAESSVAGITGSSTVRPGAHQTATAHVSEITSESAHVTALHRTGVAHVSTITGSSGLASIQTRAASSHVEEIVGDSSAIEAESIRLAENYVSEITTSSGRVTTIYVSASSHVEEIAGTSRTSTAPIAPYPGRTHTVPAESRTAEITADTRRYTIPAESRTARVLPEVSAVNA